MEAKIIALLVCCRDLFPIIDMVESVTCLVNLLPIRETTMKLSVHEDNSVALVLAKTLPPQFTPQSKYYAIKTIWFCKEIHKRCVQLLKIDTVEQLGEIFTKGLVQVTFEYLWKKINGWWVMGHRAQGALTLHILLYPIPFSAPSWSYGTDLGREC
jgi:hypothetical protein